MTIVEKTFPESTTHFADVAGKYVGHRHAGRIEVYKDEILVETRPFDDGPPPTGAIQVPSAPAGSTDTWNGTQWVVGDRPELVPTDLEIAIELLKAADPAGWDAKRQKIVDARRAAAGV